MRSEGTIMLRDLHFDASVVANGSHRAFPAAVG